MAGQMLRVTEVAERLACSERTIRRWIADGTLPSIKFEGLRRVPEEVLDRMIGSGDPDWLDDPIDGSDATETAAETTRSGADFDSNSHRKSGEKK